MPTLQWIGKEAIVSHADKVPFRVLERQYSYANPVETCHGASPSSNNKIIHGDNLEALKALLPQYEGKIKKNFRKCQHYQTSYHK